jgi:hypothetical protein
MPQLYKQLAEGLQACFDYRQTTLSTLVFVGVIEGHRKTIFSLVPGESSADEGVRFQAYADRLAEYLGVNQKDVISFFSEAEGVLVHTNGAAVVRITGFFKTSDQIARFLSELRSLQSR